MRDILRWVLHWLSAPAGDVDNVDVEIWDAAKTIVAVSDRTRG